MAEKGIHHGTCQKMLSHMVWYDIVVRGGFIEWYRGVEAKESKDEKTIRIFDRQVKQSLICHFSHHHIRWLLYICVFLIGLLYSAW